MSDFPRAFWRDHGVLPPPLASTPSTHHTGWAELTWENICLPFRL